MTCIISSSASRGASQPVSHFPARHGVSWYSYEYDWYGPKSNLLYPDYTSTVRVIYKAPRSRVRVDTAGEDEAEPQARPSTSQPDPPVHGDEGPYINRVVWSEMNATASGLYVSTHVACRVSAQTDIGSARSRVSTDTRSARSRVSTDTRSAHRRVSTDTRSAHRPCMLSDISTRGATP